MAAEEVLAIVGGRVIDGLGCDPIEKGTILIEREWPMRPVEPFCRA
jgi:hypothetical protein